MVKPEPIYIPPPEPPRLGDLAILALAWIGAIVGIGGMCIIAVILSAAWECVHRGICS